MARSKNAKRKANQRQNRAWLKAGKTMPPMRHQGPPRLYTPSSTEAREQMLDTVLKEHYELPIIWSPCCLGVVRILLGSKEYGFDLPIPIEVIIHHLSQAIQQPLYPKKNVGTDGVIDFGGNTFKWFLQMKLVFNGADETPKKQPLFTFFKQQTDFIKVRKVPRKRPRDLAVMLAVQESIRKREYPFMLMSVWENKTEGHVCVIRLDPRSIHTSEEPNNNDIVIQHGVRGTLGSNLIFENFDPHKFAIRYNHVQAYFLNKNFK